MTACHNHKKNIESVGQYHLLANEYTVRVLKILFKHKCYEEMDFKVQYGNPVNLLILFPGLAKNNPYARMDER